MLQALSPEQEGRRGPEQPPYLREHWTIGKYTNMWRIDCWLYPKAPSASRVSGDFYIWFN